MEKFAGVNEEKIREYARLVVCTGVNVQPGQEIVIQCPAEHYAFGRLLVEEAYRAGAGEVIVHWSDSLCSRQFYQNASEERLAFVPEWLAESRNYYSRRGAGYISVAGSDQCSLVADIGNVSAAESGCLTRHQVHIHRVIGLDVAQMHLEHLYAVFQLRQIDIDLTVETAGAQQGFVKNISAVGGGKDDDTAV